MASERVRKLSRPRPICYTNVSTGGGIDRNGLLIFRTKGKKIPGEKAGSAATLEKLF